MIISSQSEVPVHTHREKRKRKISISLRNEGHIRPANNLEGEQYKKNQARNFKLKIYFNVRMHRTNILYFNVRMHRTNIIYFNVRMQT